MKVSVDFCLIPLGVGISLSEYIVKCQQILEDAGLECHLHGQGTNVAGEWDEVFAAIKKCHETVHAMGAPRITASLRMGTRVDREQTFEDKIRSVEEKRGSE